MSQKQRELMARRDIGDTELLGRLRASERQIWQWQQSRAPHERSALLKWYFRLFGRA